MTRKMRPYCASTVLVFFLFFLTAPDRVNAFDSDALKTAGIVSGITVGVALLIVLVAGTVHDLKKDRDDQGREEDWSQRPVLRALGYRSLGDPPFRGPGTLPESPYPQRFAGLGELRAFQGVGDETVRFEGFSRFSAPVPRSLDLRGVPSGLRPSGISFTREAEQPVPPLQQPRNGP